MQKMRGRQVAGTLTGFVAVVSALLGGGAVWLLVTQPATVAMAVADRGVAGALLVILRTLVLALVHYI